MEAEMEESADAEVEEQCIRGVHMITNSASVDISTHVHVCGPWVFYPSAYHGRVSVGLLKRVSCGRGEGTRIVPHVCSWPTGPARRE